MLPRSGILEWNIGQAAGSSASSLASGLIFTIPALFMWNPAPTGGKAILQFGLLALCGGLLGVLFMVPLRRFLIVQEHATLPYPEGTASAQLLMAADAGGNRARQVFQRLGLGALYKALAGLAKLWPDEVALKVPVLPKAQIGIEPTPGQGDALLQFLQFACVVRCYWETPNTRSEDIEEERPLTLAPGRPVLLGPGSENAV